MAGFAGFGQDTAAIAKSCALNANAADMAAFLAAQQDIIQDKAIRDRLEGKKPEAASGAAQKQNGGKPKAASEAYAKMKEMLGSLK